MQTYYVYILASLSRRLYVGVTNDLRRRVWEHKSGIIQGHTSDYRIIRLVYFEQTGDAATAITREKQLKRWPRWRKERLIEGQNAGWLDLSVDWFAPTGSRPDLPQMPGH
jgi:putative endonuclease